MSLPDKSLQLIPNGRCGLRLPLTEFLRDSQRFLRFLVLSVRAARSGRGNLAVLQLQSLFARCPRPLNLHQSVVHILRTVEVFRDLSGGFFVCAQLAHHALDSLRPGNFPAQFVNFLGGLLVLRLLLFRRNLFRCLFGPERLFLFLEGALVVGGFSRRLINRLLVLLQFALQPFQFFRQIAAVFSADSYNL